MNVANRRQLAKHLMNAAVFIVAIALNNWATAQNVYKCENSYSQAPCPGGQAVNVDDARTAEQKKQTDTAVRLDAKEALSLEKVRRAQEKAALTQLPHVTPSTDTATTHATPVDRTGLVHQITPKRIKPKTYKPDVFVALVPGSEKEKGTKNTVKKAVKKKATQSTTQKAASSGT